MRPIWQDTYYTTSAATFDFYLTDDSGDNVLFSGRSTRFPDAVTLKINVSRILENYLTETISDYVWISTGGTWNDTSSVREFRLYDGDDNYIETFQFYNNWSYDPDFDTKWDLIYKLSSPINGHYTPGMYMFDSQLDSDAIEIDHIYTTSSSNLYPTLSCGDYALYYLNRYGGFDSFLVEGKVTRTDTYEAKTFRKRVSPGETQHSETRYLNDITPTWKLNTSWLTDSQAEALATHLFPSNCVYLHNLKDNEVYPVVITDTSAEHKTFRNTKKLVSYEISVKASATMTTR